MHGLTVRWSLAGAPPGTAEALRDYVRDTSVARFTGRPGLVQKTWQLDGESFAGIYVWATEQARAAFVEQLRSTPSPVDALVGSTPELLQEWELVGLAVGAEGPLAP
jgi:hypothetical protein